MKLELETKLNSDEITEIRKRAYSFAEQMFYQGLSIGRELNREPFQNKTEQYIKDRLAYMTSYFVRDDIWESMPPQGYNPNPNVSVPEFIPGTTEFRGDVEKMKYVSENTLNMVNSSLKDENKPEWADKNKPFN